MASIESENFLPAPEILKPSYADHLVADPRDPNLANVKVKEHGYYVSYIVEDYDKLPQTEKNKLSKVAVSYKMDEKYVRAALDYRYVHKDAIDARVLLNKVQSGNSEILPQEIESAQEILQRSQGEKDIHLDWDRI